MRFNHSILTAHLQHDYNATQVPPEWHAWLQHIRKDPPQEDRVMQNLTPPWKAVRSCSYCIPHARTNHDVPALGRESHRYSRSVQALQHCEAQGCNLGAHRISARKRCLSLDISTCSYYTTNVHPRITYPLVHIACRQQPSPQ